MALVHEQLYNSDNLALINFGTYLKELVQSLQVSYGIDTNRITTRIDCPKIFIGIDTAIPCGLIVNELISNCFKHAFPGDRQGNIEVRFFQKGDDQIHLLVADTGCGLAPEFNIMRTRSLGLKLVYNLVSHQLEGEIDILEKPGTCFAISFPYNSKLEKNRLML